MEFLRFVFNLGVIYITFDILWNIFLFLLRLIFGIDRQENLVYHIFKGVSYYLLVSLTAATSLRYMNLAVTDMGIFGFSFLGLVILYFYITSAMEKKRLKAAVRMDVLAIRRMRYNSIYLFLSLLLYIVCMYFPILVETQVLNLIFNAIDEIFNLLLFRWIIGFLALLFLINMLYKSFTTTKYLIYGLFGIREKSTSSYKDMYGDDPHHTHHETIDVEYREVDEDEEEGEENGRNTLR